MLEDLLIPRHPDDDCHYSQKELLRHAPNIVERNRLAQLLRWGNATYCYYHYNQVQVTKTDYLEWLEGLPETAQATMRALGFEEMNDSLPLRRYVLEKNDVGLSAFLRTVLSASDWQDYQQVNSAALNPWLPPLT
ncbi:MULTISPECIES: hypothetical protein [Hymenobacter]|uniref:Uncharacterized protein n=1 Tax=Hymenobacter mucosus TaxID=1411120 RepID=A0A239AXU3_9BACT|nr:MULTISPECIES: hypothetical protein [Hymenobacter]MDF7815541.1 hypothetical protein [Hymenobacter sp. YC55]SNS00556.1 hypothetical protein SAMN06269173_11638 [Hymenobacter mucosus]